MSKTMDPVETVISVLGVRPLARALGIYPSTVERWRERRMVPGKYHKQILKLADGELTTDDLIWGR